MNNNNKNNANLAIPFFAYTKVAIANSLRACTNISLLTTFMKVIKTVSDTRRARRAVWNICRTILPTTCSSIAT